MGKHNRDIATGFGNSREDTDMMANDGVVYTEGAVASMAAFLRQRTLQLVKICILGAGALGSAIGGTLAAAGSASAGAIGRPNAERSNFAEKVDVTVPMAAITF
jgi:hypothetical protein